MQSGTTHIAHHAHHRYEIVPESDVGFYVIRYADSTDKSTYDYLQDTLEMAMECAHEEFAVPIGSWTPVPKK
ncbi:hypothetical protein Fuma_05635 [Fuerstiella marisgermanici]|uniref:Uncharacterized protein n=2 Tax=Fuerstiella marisgermanici TaxID=1891926 RepID=A0A1P8WPH9_9PLAN|nr:hypothetical protein Fuma_05635 [Fuerstiella marisgermanici]